MKKLLLILGLGLIIINSFGQAKRPRDLERQNSYSDSLDVVVDDDSYTSVHIVKAAILAPKINDEDSETSDLDKDTYELRISSGGNDEFRAKLRLINPDIVALSTKTDIDNTDYLTLYDESEDDRDEKITFSNFLNTLISNSIVTDGIDDRFGNSDFNDAVDDQVDIKVDESYILGLISEDEEDELYLATNKTCEIYAQRIGNQVNGIIRIFATGTGVLQDGAGGANYTLPANFRPTSSCRFRVLDGSDYNTISISSSSGEINGDFDVYPGSGFIHIPFSYVTLTAL